VGRVLRSVLRLARGARRDAVLGIVARARDDRDRQTGKKPKKA
jgi:hypothetical protein